jgi:hypothetical protein
MINNYIFNHSILMFREVSIYYYFDILYFITLIEHFEHANYILL